MKGKKSNDNRKTNAKSLWLWIISDEWLMSSLGNGNTDCNTVLLIRSNTVGSCKVIDIHDDNDNDDSDMK